MKKTIHCLENCMGNKGKWCLIILSILFSNFSFGQTITPLKTVTNSATNCGIIDVKLDITGTNPGSRNSDVILVIDVSESMNYTIPNDTKKPMQYAKDAAKSFINAASSNPNNRVAIVSYGTLGKLEIGLTYLDSAGIAALFTKINNLTSTDYTNMQDGIVKASTELNSHGRFDCATARSIVFLTDGITNRTGPTASIPCSVPSKTSTCVTTAIEAANIARKTTISSVDYNNQIFAIGLLGGITGNIDTNGSQRNIAKYTLDMIQGGTNQATITYQGSDLTNIYNNIATQLTWVAQNLVEKETVPSGYTISDITASKGVATQSGQQINWNIDILNSEKITLNYKLAPSSTICGSQIVSTSSLEYTNSSCKPESKAITTASVNIPCPKLTLASKTDINCFGGTDGTITLNDATGGNSPYTYDWSDIATSPEPKNRTGLKAGTYTVIAKDNTGCSAAPLVITITEPTVLNASIAKTDVSCNEGNDGTITVSSPTGGSGTFEYRLNSGDWQVSPSFTALAAGTYSVQIRDKANISCFKVLNEQIIIQPQNPITATAVINSNNNCTNCSNGSINLTVIGGTEPYTFVWSNGATTEDIANLANGSYSVEIKDKKGCIANYTFTISESSINITKEDTYVDSNQDGITNAGDIVAYNFVIKNTGTVTLTNVTLTDNNAVITGGPIATLAAGATDSTTFSATHTITQSDINLGFVYNLAIANSKDPNDISVTDTSSDPTPCTICPIDPNCQDCTITPLNQTPGLEVIKTAAVETYSKVGEVINFSIIVKNTGNQTLHQIIVKDPLTGLNTIIAILEPGTSSKYSQDYIVTQEDLNKGSIINVATADGLTPSNKPISATDDAIVNKKINLIDAVDDNAGKIVGVNQTTSNVINVFTNDTLNASPVNPSDVILTTITSNPFLQLNSDGSVDVLPNAPTGTQTMTYQICEKLNNTNCDTATVTVIIEGPSMTITGEAICINDVPYFNYTAKANNFNPVNGLTLVWTDSTNKVVATMTNLPLSGRVLWPGAVVDDNGNGIDWPGWILENGKWTQGPDGFENIRPVATVTYTLNPSETITVNYPPADPYCTSRPTFKIDAVDDTAGPIDGVNGATNILNVFNNDTLNTVAVNPADVTLTLVTPDATGYMTMNPNGSIDLKNGTPAGTYTLVYQICENADNGNCDTATVTITVICSDKTKVSGIVYNAGTNTPLANVPVTLIPQGATPGSTLMVITRADGSYSFTGMIAGDYLVQVQDANLNSAYQLYPVNSSLFFTTLETCKYQKHDFGYDKSIEPVLGDFVWYDANNNGIQDEWFDANNDNLVTQNIPDANGSIDYSKWEWVDLNGDGSYKGTTNVGELNAAGFGNAKSANIFVTGPNNYSDSVIIGIQGYWRNRPTAGNLGDYKVELKMDNNLEAQSSALGATGLVKILPTTTHKGTSKKTAKLASREACSPTNENPQFTTITTTNMVDLDLDFGISCKMLADIQANDDTYNVTQCSIANEIRNALSNDLLNGAPAKIADLKFNLLSNLNQYIDIDTNGNTTFKEGLATGQYVFDYQVCEAANPTNCSTAKITINVAGIEALNISGAACNADTTPIDLSKLLPEGVPTTGTWIDKDNTGGLIGNILNPIDIPVNQYKYEYKIEGNCPRSILLTMDINDDCKVLPCKNIIVHNAISANEDGKNDYFQIENLENNDCYKNFKVEIFNRWGILVFEKENYDNEANAFRGRSEGRTTINKSEGLPTGTYFYIISYDSVDNVGQTQNIKKNGYLYLVR
ncbi:DUF7507 domain-containing protein [Flavobacterium sp.]|uniref:DUF7507 domain-containing protein n=1 Tax=Flavobacterium sp. TaxID=239 RepID=UPI002BB5A5F2|nr:gliding motility-associated C-terminal domain-containing protein [Flavobacterium sp.]HSD08656.1 gliding motility-associated C-terminal domain-containing protein [Flavobacterium sp.]